MVKSMDQRSHNRPGRLGVAARFGSLVGPYLAWAGGLFALYLTSFHHYLLFHSLSEIFSVVIACGIFMFVWNSRRFFDNNFFTFIGIAYLFIALIDTLHTLAYEGMDVFRGYDSDLGTQLWVQARFIQGMSWVIAPFLLGRQIRIRRVFVAFAVVVALLLASLFFWRIFPTCFVPGEGLTPFKKGSEYFISGIFFIAIVLLIRKRRYFDPEVLRLLLASIGVTILSELSFSQYATVSGMFNLLGHLFKIIAFYLLYKATIEIGLSKPYNLLFRNLKSSETQLLKEKNKVQTYLDIAGVIIIVLDDRQRVTLINKKGCEILGRDASEVIGQDWFDAFVPAAVRQQARQACAGLITGQGESQEYYENAVLARDGQERLIAWHNKVLFDGQGQPTATISSGEDITERRRLEDILKENEELFRTAVDNYPSIFVIYDAKQRIKFMNAYGVRLYGIPIQDMLGRQCTEIHPAHVTQTFLPVLRKVFETKTTHTVECPMHFPSGIFRFVMTYVPMLNEDRDINQVLGIGYDVTERKLAEDALKKVRDDLEMTVGRRTAELRATNELLERIFLSTHFSIVYLDPQFHFIRVNKAYADACGHPQEYFVGKNHFDLYPDAENQRIFTEVLKTGQPFSTFARPFEFPDHPEWGVTYWDWSLLPVKTAAGHIEGLVFCLVDVTKRELAEQELSRTQKKLVEAQRLSDIGTLAATVAHELRNPLAAIHMTSFNMLRKAKDPSLKKYFSVIEKKIEESDQIINNLLFYSRLRPPSTQKILIGDLVKECLSLAQSVYAKQAIVLEKKMESLAGVVIDGDPVQLKEVFNNLIHNAYDALWGRTDGTITLQGMVDGPDIAIVIQDNGPGIDEDVLQNIFDPFFTTKAKGTGLGLTVCKQIIDLHGGVIRVQTQPGQGTGVTVRLPIGGRR